MKAARRQQLLLCLLPLALGVALSFKLPHLKPLIELEHALFWFPQKNDTLVEREPLKEFQVRVFDISHDNSEKKAIRALSTSDDSSVTDWLFALNAVRTHGADHATVSTLLSWEDSVELELRALDHEIASFPSSALGITLRLDSTPQPFPDYLKVSVLPSGNIETDISLIPEVNAVTSDPSATGKLYGFRLLENSQPQIENDTISLPILARWGDRILPSLELASLIANTGHAPADVSLSKNGQLRIGTTGPVLPLREDGTIEIPRRAELGETTPMEALIDPEKQPSPSKVVFISQNDPVHLRQLDFSLSHLGSRLPRAPISFHRLPCWIEISILILLALVLQTKKPLALLFVPLAPILATTAQQWWVLTPAISLVATFLLLKLVLKKESLQASAPQQKEEPKIVPDSEIKPESKKKSATKKAAAEKTSKKKKDKKKSRTRTRTR
ncbi:MAG: hypothetical protein OSA93_17360, partial [Akkermansiaceae bacterium]|nr:hypothetical protein [Akkermansiaceae bacterium]